MALVVSVYGEEVQCDRYHLLRPNSTVTSIPIYVETGVAFNGFDQPVILNVPMTTIYNSRIIKIQSPDILNNRRIYCLVTQMKAITKNKCAVSLELDAWMTYSYKEDRIIGLNNTIFESSEVIDYPYYDMVAKDKIITKSVNIEDSVIFNVLMLYHDAVSNNDDVYFFAYYRINGFGFYSQKFVTALQSLNLDANNIIGIYFSPFDLNSYFTQMVYEDSPMTFQVYKRDYNSFMTYSNSAPKYNSFQIVDDYYHRTVITDMTGSPVWTSIREDAGTKVLVRRIDLRYDGCVWDCSMSPSSSTTVVTSPNKRFGISCVSLGYFLDYYQQYQNTQKSYNSELRKAQLDKQLMDNIGGIVSSTMSGGIGGAIGGSAPAGAVAGAIGGISNTVLSYYSTAEYNEKLEVIEDRQAKIQYDSLIAGSNTFFPYLVGETMPAINIIRIDEASEKAGFYDNSTPYIRYNCRIRPSDLSELIFENTPFYLSGDFDFIGMNVGMANQLNERFRHGVNFVTWE